MNDVKKTGTTTVGVKCKDCIILAADKRATAGHMIVDKKVQKVKKVGSHFALTTAGSVSDLQLLEKYLKAELKLRAIRINRESTVKEAVNLLGGMIYSNIRGYSMIPGVTHFLFAGYDTDLHLYDLYPDGSITQIDNFVSSGSGSVFALGVLEANYKENMTEAEGIDLVKKAISASLQRDSASGNGIDVFRIDKNGAEKIETKLVEVKLN